MQVMLVRGNTVYGCKPNLKSGYYQSKIAGHPLIFYNKLVFFSLFTVQFRPSKKFRLNKCKQASILLKVESNYLVRSFYAPNIFNTFAL